MPSPEELVATLTFHTLSAESLRTCLGLVSSLGGGAALITKGTFTIAASVVVPANVTLLGQGVRPSSDKAKGRE